MVGNADLVTVVIPSYNHGRFIGSTIQSIIDQTHQNLELIIIDDNSSDNTKEVIEGYLAAIEKRFSRFQVIYKKENLGISDSLNQATDLANSEFIYFIASDDVAKSSSIAILYGFIKDHEDYAMVVSDAELIDDEGQIIYWDKKQNIIHDQSLARYKTFAELLKKMRSDIDFNSDQFGSYKSLLLGNYITNNPIIRKSALLKVGKYQEGMLEDWYINLQISKYYKIKYIDQLLSYYRWHDANSIKNKDAMKEISKRTLENEIELVKKSNNEKLNNILSEYLIGEKKIIMNFLNIFEIYSLRNIFFKKTILRIFGFNFVIKKKIK